MRARKVVDELSTLQSALLELSAAFELEPQHATEGGAATEEGGKKGGGERAGGKCTCHQRPCKCGTICGIYGCSLPARHTGMCELPYGGACDRRRSLTTRAEVDDPRGEPSEEITAACRPCKSREEKEAAAAAAAMNDEDPDEGSRPMRRCERHPLCIRGYKHGGFGGRCSFKEPPRGFKHGGRAGRKEVEEVESSEGESEEEEEGEGEEEDEGGRARGSSSAGRFRFGANGKLCGTFGCTLPDRHRGLHRIPADLVRSAPRQRRAPAIMEARLGGVLGLGLGLGLGLA